MPTYAYACTTCDHRFEVQQAFTDESLSECPRCEGRLRKLFNAVGIVFKGAGFYRTDSRNSAGSRNPGASSASGGDTSPSSGGSDPGSGSSGSGSSGSGSNGSSSGSGSTGAGGSGGASSAPASPTPASATSAA